MLKKSLRPEKAKKKRGIAALIVWNDCYLGWILDVCREDDANVLQQPNEDATVGTLRAGTAFRQHLLNNLHLP